MNLYKLLATTERWEQLWSDDTDGYILRSTESKKLPYEVLHAWKFGGDVMISPTYCESLDQAMHFWNGSINKHISKETEI
jgi:hypothetical protein